MATIHWYHQVFQQVSLFCLALMRHVFHLMVNSLIFASFSFLYLLELVEFQKRNLAIISRIVAAHERDISCRFQREGIRFSISVSFCISDDGKFKKEAVQNRISILFLYLHIKWFPQGITAFKLFHGGGHIETSPLICSANLTFNFVEINFVYIKKFPSFFIYLDEKE